MHRRGLSVSPCPGWAASLFPFPTRSLAILSGDSCARPAGFRSAHQQRVSASRTRDSLSLSPIPGNREGLPRGGRPRRGIAGGESPMEGVHSLASGEQVKSAACGNRVPQQLRQSLSKAFSCRAQPWHAGGTPSRAPRSSSLSGISSGG